MEQQNILANGMPPQNMNMNMNMNSMQRPQPGNSMQQLHARIMDNLQRRMGTLPPGWQSTFDLGQRANRIMQLLSSLRMLSEDTSTCLTTAESFEERTIKDAPNKEVYMDLIGKKMSNIQHRRQQAAQKLQNGQLNMPMNGVNMGMPQQNMGNMNMLQNSGMAGMNMTHEMVMPNGQMGGAAAQANQSFPTQLQQQMQPSPLPQQQQQNTTMDPSQLQNSQAPVQMHNMNQPNQQQPNMNQGGQARQNGQQDDPIVAHAKRTFNQLSEERRTTMRNHFLGSLPEQQRQKLTSQPGDPLFKFLHNRSKHLFQQQRAGQMNQQNSDGMQMANNMTGNSMQQTPSQQSGGSNFDFSSIMGQQANAIKSAESGEQVVPASFNAGNPMPQGVNPQMLGNQNNQQGSNQGSQFNVPLMAMQQEKQRRERLQKQNQIAHQQAIAQQQAQNQLRGQPGGLSTPNALTGGPVNSPAMNMSMLNRPLAPPGQNTPSTPQQNRSQGMPQTPVDGANQLAQHHQSMLNQNNQQQQMNQGGQGMTVQQRILASMPQEARAKIEGLAPEDQIRVIQNWAYQRAQANGTMGGAQGGPAMPPNMNIGGPQAGGPQSMPTSLPPNMGNAIPGFNSVPPPNQQHPQQGQDSVAFQQKMQQHQQAQNIRQRAMDMAIFPKLVLQSLGMSVPDHVNEWGKLRNHIAQNQSVLPQDSLHKLQLAQGQWFQTHPEELQAAMQNFQQRVHAARQANLQGQQQQQPPTSRPPSAIPVPNGQAPQAQMVPTAPPMQQGQNQNMGGVNMNQQGPVRMPQVQPPTDNDVRVFREKVPNAHNMTDDNIKAALMRRKQQAAQAQALQMQQNMRNAQMQRAQAVANGAAHPNNAPPSGQQQPQRPPQPQQGPSQQVNNQGQGQKRPQTSSDDVVEIPNPSAPPTGVPQAPAMQPTRSQQPQQPRLPPRMPTKEEVQRMSPDQQQLFMQQMRQFEALRKAQSGIQNSQAGAPPNQQPLLQPQQVAPQQQVGHQQQMLNEQEQQRRKEAERLNVVWMEVSAENPKGKAVQLNSSDLEQMQALLKKLWAPTFNIDKTFMMALRAPNFGENRIRGAMKAKLIVQQNAKDEHGNFKEYLAVTPPELKMASTFLTAYFADLKALKARQDAAKGLVPQDQVLQAPPTAQAQVQQAQPEQQRPKPQQPSQAPPLNRKQSQQGHGRKASQNTKAPPAPTENKTFDWGAPSPQGVPKYDARRNDLTPDKLKMPQNKRQKTGDGQTKSQVTTPAAQIGTPGAMVGSPGVGVTKAPSPDHIRKMQPQPPRPAAEPSKPRFKCDDEQCDASITGFENDELLQEHKAKEHQPVEDPLKFLFDVTAEAPKPAVDAKAVPASKAAAQPRGRPVPAVKSAIKKEGQTPSIKQESLTPASTGKAAGRSGPATAKQNVDVKAPASITPVPEKQKTLMEVMADKVGFPLPATDAKPDHVTNPDEAWIDSFSNELVGHQGVTDLEDWSRIDSVTDWGLRPEPESSPELTPSSLASHSSRESDVSQSDRLRMNMEWDAFGNGDTGVPEGLLRTWTLDERSDASDGAEATMTEGEEVNVAREGTEDPMNWSSDYVDWDGFFGHDAGLEGNGNWSTIDIPGLNV
ncbi:hypothetical protein LTR37_006368 [Vermiconidia calcicola]|uniref:Uncharacterized protein n=1 Tax=Vermiconidia calcicola TaxID=1690605 RepID=A0ACC3NGP5_9PEZI|nr:hypothetical protein LTR37_006368 [Vermiconidia calcicola]